jgi:hypothetical protein
MICKGPTTAIIIVILISETHNSYSPDPYHPHHQDFYWTLGHWLSCRVEEGLMAGQLN